VQRKRITINTCLRGVAYPKARLPLAIVKAFVRDFPVVTYKELKNIFKDYLQGSLGVVLTVEEIRRKTSDPQKRYYMDSPVLLADGTIVYVCSQWGSGLNFEDFLKVAKILKYEVATLKASMD
jgi:hypothetical protein